MLNEYWYKNSQKDKVWWKATPDSFGEWLFSFDKKTVFNLFKDYPHKLTAEQKELFDRENPHWVEFFKDRQAIQPADDGDGSKN